MLFLAYCVLSVLLLAPMSFDLSTRLPDDGDALQGLWIVWWGASHLSSPGDYFDANAYYPHPDGLVYSEPMVSESALAWPLFGWFQNRVLVINLLTILTMGLSALGFHWLAYELTGSHLGAFVGATFYAFNAYVFSHLAQLQLVSIQWIPLALLCLHRFFATSKRGYALGFVAFTMLVGLASFYYLLFFAVALVFVVPGSLRSLRFRLGWMDFAVLLPAACASAAILYWVSLPYRRVFDLYEFSGDPARLDLASFFTPPHGSLLYRNLGPDGPLSYFLGYATLLLILVGWFRSKASGAPKMPAKATWWSYSLLGIFAFFCAAGPHVFFARHYLGRGPFQLLQLLGPYEKLREPPRFAVVVNLVVALLLARGVAALTRGRSRRVALATTAVASALVIGEQWSPERTQGMEIPVGEDVPEVYRWLGAREEPGALAELPVRPFRQIRRTSMEAYFSTFHRRPILFAKPSFYPPAMELLQWELRDFPDEKSIALLQALDVRFAVVHPARWEMGRRVLLRRLGRLAPRVELLKRFPDREDALWREYQLGGEHLYRIDPSAPLSFGTPRACDCREIDRSTMKLDANGVTPPALAVDGNRHTKWTTAGGQEKGDYFEITFDRPRRPVRIEIEMASPYGEFPRNLEMNGYVGQRGFRLEQREDVAYTVELVRTLVSRPTEARLRYDLAPRTMDRLRLFIHRKEEATIDWSIAEIHVFESDTDSTPESADREPASRLPKSD